MAILRVETARWPTPAVTIVAQREGNPFKVLISCILSLRTLDTTTGPASERLFALAATPESMAQLSQDAIERAIYPVGFYRTKAAQIIDICRQLTESFGGIVPDDLERLMQFKGVGRKTANLVITLGYGKPGICVDTHVHRICNRWGYVATSTPDETEMVLRRKLPSHYWLEINDLLVTYGQNLCRPQSPHCSICNIASYCRRTGVTVSR